jgi:ribosome-associated toxin RatA of RatAB toxin-antitoxin module
MKVSDVIMRIPISASANKVWEVLADFGGVEKWAPTVVKCRRSTEANSGLGAKRILTTSRGDDTEEVIVEWNEGKSFTFEIPDGLASIVKTLSETWSVEQSPDGASVVVRMDYQMKNGILYSILDSLVVRHELRKLLVQNLAGLKYYLETRKTVTGLSTGLPIDAVEQFK